MRVFVAGGTGVVGRRLVRQLVARGHQVTATTTSTAKLALLEQLGAQGAVMDGLDPVAVSTAVATARPDAIVSQMTALAPDHVGKASPSKPEYFATTNRLRSEGTDHLIAAAAAVGGCRVVVQGAAIFNCTPEGGPIKSEDDPLEVIGGEAVYHLEDAVSRADGAVLRYGALYAPDAIEGWVSLVRKRMFPIVGGGNGWMSLVHADDAAAATVLAVERKAAGVFNIVDDEPAPIRDWVPYLAQCVGAKPPLRLPTWLVRPMVGEMMVAMMTQGHGFSNAKAKRELGWQLAYPSWRDGFKAGFA